MRLPFWGTILTVLGFVVLCWLGSWQLDRLQWKAGILDAVEVEYAVDASGTVLSLGDLSVGTDFKRGYFEGAYLHDKEIFLQARTHKGTPGYHLFVPFRLLGQGGAIILVNRGWIPIEQEMPDDGVVTRPEGVIKITGMLRKATKANMFVPDNQPDDEAWYQIDIAQITQVRGLGRMASDLFYVEAEGTGAALGGAHYPISAATKISPNNNHAQYAFFWFIMAAMMIVVYILRFVAPQSMETSD